MADNLGCSLLQDGDQEEQRTWTKLEPYLSKYEKVWLLHVVPLRCPGSIYLRAGIDEALELFAMNNYTAYVNVARAFEKIEINADDLKFSEEIWANLQRAVEVAKDAATAFSNVCRECMKKDTKIDTQRLERAEASVKSYRNRLHDPIPATLKDQFGTRLIPKRDKLDKYKRWTTAMYNRDPSDFLPVEKQLQDDFSRVCSALQDFWTQIEKLSGGLTKNAEYRKRIAAGSLLDLTRFGDVTRHSTINQDSSSVSMANPVSPSGTINVLDSLWSGTQNGPHKTNNR